MPNFTLHLHEVDLEGSPLQLDFEVKMVEGYPDEKPPEIRLIKRRGLTTGQVESISGALMKRCQELIGAEMVFDLVYEAKVRF